MERRRCWGKLVEDIRAQARQRRANAPQLDASQVLAQHIAALDLDAKRVLIKAFANRACRKALLRVGGTSWLPSGLSLGAVVAGLPGTLPSLFTW